MHIHVPDKRNVGSHFCLQAYLSEQKFPRFVLVSFFCCYSIAFHKVRSCRVSSYRLGLHWGFFLPVGLFHNIDYVPFQTRYINNVITNTYIQSFNWYLVLVARAEVFKYKYLIMLTNFRNVLPFYLNCR